MSIRNKTLRSLGLPVAVLAALAVTACDPYQAPTGGAPAIIGVAMFDTEMNYWNNLVLPVDTTGCIAPYPQVDQAWANTAFPGLCNPDNLGSLTTVCPVLCYPPRTGPAFAPLFYGNMGGSYQTVLPGQGQTFTYALPFPNEPGRYILGALQPVPPNVTATDVYGDTYTWTYQRIDITFNKLMDPKTIQPNPGDCLPQASQPVSIRVLENGVDITSTTAVCYNPNADMTYWGASINISPENGIAQNSVYRVTGTVSDHDGNTLDLNVTVNTGVDIDDSAPALRKK